MSGKGKKRRAGFYGDNYFQSSAWNQRTFAMYRNWIYAIALTRFKWVNLPPTCNERYLEWTLLNQGVATIAFPKKQPGVFYSTQAALSGVPTVYDDYSAWESFGNNGWRFKVSPKNGVLVWENMERFPIHNAIDLFARRLAAFDRTLDINLKAQHNPIALTAPREQRNDLLQIFKQIDGGETAIIGTDALRETLDQIKALDLGVPFIGNELQAAQQTYWNQIYTFLGIESLPFKMERMIEDEVTSVNEPSSLRALDPLTARREACDKLNARFGKYLDEPIGVFWRKDWRGDNYDATHDVADMREVIGDDDAGVSSI